MEKNIEQNSQTREEVYKKLLEKRGLERHKEIRGWTERDTSFEERKKLLEKIKGEIPAVFGLEEEGKDLKESEILQEEIRRLEEEIAQITTQEETKELRNESLRRLGNSMRERRRLLKAVDQLHEGLEEMKKDYQNEARETKRKLTAELISEYSQQIERIRNILENELPSRNPESFLAHSLLKLRQYKKELPSGIVETDYPRTQKERAEEILVKNRLAAFLGETGTGKTRLARKIAEEMTGDYEFVPGHRFITADDLFYSRGLDVQKISPSQVPEIIKKEMEKFNETHPDVSEKERETAAKIIEQVVQGQAASKELTSQIFLSSVLKAASDGKIVIIDEFNYIPPALLGGCNALIEAKPNEEISVFGQKIKVKPGFGVILTGNITRSELQGRYLQREKIDPALVNRLNSGLIEYASLPQASVSFGESILSRSEFKEGEEILSRELFQIGLAILADEKGNISGPRELLEKTWNLSGEFSLLQKLYAGEKLETPVKLESGQDVVLKEYAISNRTYRAVLEHWKNDNYRFSIDWYVYDNLIRPASIISPSEAGQIFSLLKKREMFFQDRNWEILKVNPITYRIEGIEEIERRRKDFLKKQELKNPTYYFAPQEVAEAFLGVAMPALEEIETVKKELVDKERMKKYQELKEKYEELEAFIKVWEETAELYCLDEKAILGEEK